MKYIAAFFTNGVTVNAIAVIAASLLGSLFKKSLPKKLSDSVICVFGLVLIYIGFKGSLSGENTLVLIISMVAGAIIGTAIDIDTKMHNLGLFAQRKLASRPDSRMAEAFVNSSLVICVGAMAVIGSLNSALRSDNAILYTKSILDFIIILLYASTMGIGVILSAVAVFLWEGLIFVCAGFAEPLLSEYAINEMNCAGSILIAALGFNTVGISKFKIANYLPAVFIPIILCLFM